MTEQQRIQQRYQERDASPALSGFWTLRNPVVLHLAQERERAVLAALARHGIALDDARVLDVGCAGGGEFANHLRWGVPLAGIAGVDLMLPRLQLAQRLFGSRVVQASGAALPFADASFGMVVQNVVFSSITDAATRRQVAAEMLRVLRPGGCLLWYDAVRTRSRDVHFQPVPVAELRSLFPGLRWDIRSVSTDLGLLRRVHALLGARGMAVLDATGRFKTHVVALGLQA